MIDQKIIKKALKETIDDIGYIDISFDSVDSETIGCDLEYVATTLTKYINKELSNDR